VDLPGYVFADINLKMAIPLILLSVKLVGHKKRRFLYRNPFLNKLFEIKL